MGEDGRQQLGRGQGVGSGADKYNVYSDQDIRG